MQTLTVNNKRTQARFDIGQIESKYNATYVGEFSLKDTKGQWVNDAVSVFYVEKPEKPEYSNYFGIFSRNGVSYITDASCAAQTPFVGIVADNGEVIYSAYRHDFTESCDKSVFIDGGREYVRSGGNGQLVLLKIIRDQIVPYVNMPEEVSKLLGGTP